MVEKRLESKLAAELGDSPEKAGRVLDEFDREVTITDVETGEKEKVERYCVLRYAIAEDFLAIKSIDLDKKEFRSKHYQAKNEHGSKRPGSEHLAEDLTGHGKKNILVLIVGYQVVGYTKFGKDPEVDKEFQEIDDTTARIYSLGVKEMYMNNGFATQLLEHAIKEAEKYYGAKRIFVETQKENKESKHLYMEKFGFGQVGSDRPSDDRHWQWTDERGNERTDCYDINLLVDVETWKEKRILKR